MRKDIIDSLYSYSKRHRDGKWFVPSVVALFQIDGSKRYENCINDASKLLPTLDREIYNRFQGVYNEIEDWVELFKIAPMRKNPETSLIADSIDATVLARKCVDKGEIAYRKINNHIYVFKV